MEQIVYPHDVAGLHDAEEEQKNGKGHQAEFYRRGTPIVFEKLHLIEPE
jgi:hypothetical protein